MKLLKTIFGNELIFYILNIFKEFSILCIYLMVNPYIPFIIIGVLGLFVDFLFEYAIILDMLFIISLIIIKFEDQRYYYKDEEYVSYNRKFNIKVKYCKYTDILVK